MIGAAKELMKISLFRAAYLMNRPLARPDTLQLSLTNRCNLRCRMCSVDKYPTRQDEEMSFEEISRLVVTAKKQFGIQKLVLTGGEPLLMPELILKTASFAQGQGIAVVITTNGFSLKEHAHDLAFCGISHFRISLDGLERTHNHIRANPLSFQNAVSGIKSLVDLRLRHNLGYTIGIGAVVLKENIPELYDLFLVADSLGVDIIDFLPYLPDNTDFSNTAPTSMWPQEEDVGVFLRLYGKISRADTSFVKVNSSIDAALMAKYYRRRMRKGDWQCLAGLNNIFITMSDPKMRGRFEPCVFLCKAHIPVRDHHYDLKKIWHSAQARSARKDIKRCGAYCYQPCFSLPSVLKLLKTRILCSW